MLSPDRHTNQAVDLSVILCNYNQPQSVGLAVRSLLEQDFDGKHEIIVTDDGSSIDFFRDHRDILEESPIPTRYHWQQDRGFRAAAARNAGMRLARGEVFLFLDGDQVPELNTVRGHYDLHSAHSGLIVAGNRQWCGELSDEEYAQLDRLPTKEAIQFLHDHTPDTKSQYREAQERKTREEWASSSWPARVCFSAHLSVPRPMSTFFDERFAGWGFEDWDFAMRLESKEGYRPTYHPELTAYHVETAGGAGNVFRNGGHDKIVRYCQNVFQFYSNHPTVDPEAIFFGFARFALDPKTNTWMVVSRPEEGAYDLGQTVETMREWLYKNVPK